MVQNPTLYVQIGSAKKIDIISLAERTHPPGGAICLQLGEPVDKLIRAAKACLQSGEMARPGTQRVNIYVIAIAHEPQVVPLTLHAGERLCALFAEDFATFHITLAVLVDESNEADRDGFEYETRAAATYDFLASLTGATAFDRIFLLSNRNEFGRVSGHDYMYHMCQLLAFLPLLHGCQNSRFDETMNAKAAEAGRVLFASAGFGVGDLAVDVNKENRVLHELAQVLEGEVKIDLNENDEQHSSVIAGSTRNLQAESCRPSFVCVNSDKFGFEIYDMKIAGQARNDKTGGNIANAIASIASNPLSFSQIISLRGATLTEAEALIFGTAAENFFHTNYLAPHYESSTQTTLTLRGAVAEESCLAKLLEEIELEICNLSHELSQKERTPVGFFQAIDNAKTAIGQAYEIKYKLAALQVQREKHQTRYAQLHSYIQYLREVIAALKALPVEPPPETPPEQLLSQARERATLNISLLRHDGMLLESHILGEPDNPCVLRVIGGFTLEDMIRYHTMRVATTIPQTNA